MEPFPHFPIPGHSLSYATACTGQFLAVIQEPIFLAVHFAVGFLGTVIPKIIQVKVEENTEIKIFCKIQLMSEFYKILQSLLLGDIPKMKAILQLSVAVYAVGQNGP
jgi:hypothetical protein